ncbi:MAG TPA: cytochrome c maturation protein CcmE [Chitinophagaceae bacterium]
MKKVHIVGLVIIAVAIGFIVTMASNYSEYQTFSQASGESKMEFHVVGKLDSLKGMTYDPQKDANYFSFYLKDNNGDVRQVIFHGTKPQDFEKSEQIVLTGSMQGTVFNADHILMKCPSKYKSDQLEVSSN